jgi:hypothetical protein
MDREAVRRDPAQLARAERAIHRFFDEASRELPIFEPIESVTDRSDAVNLSEDSRRALSDRDWIEGYRAGLDDARRATEGLDRSAPVQRRTRATGGPRAPIDELRTTWARPTARVHDCRSARMADAAQDRE